MHYIEKDFDDCFFNPLKKGVMTKLYPSLNELGANCYDDVIRYVIMMYDPKSPLQREKDLGVRKEKAAELAEISYEARQSLFHFEDQNVTDLTIGYLSRFIKSKEYAAIVVLENCFWESAAKLLEPIKGEKSKELLEAVQKKSVIKDELEKDITRLDALYKKFYGDDTQLETAAKVRLTPEEMAKRFSNV